MRDPLTRRQFLKSTATAALALSVPNRTAGEPPITASPLSAVDRYNYILGTQTFDPSYHFTDEPRVVETAQAIRELGSSVIKLRLGHDRQPGSSGPRSLREFAAANPEIRRILAMPFAHFVLWAYPMGDKGNAGDQESGHSAEIYDLSCYLLDTFGGSGKTFYLGHWEGDWEIRGKAGGKEDPTPAAISRKIAWLNARQKAVDDAKRDTPHDDVDVFCYAEANLVRDAMKGRPAMANEVIPHTNIDFVSYSSYDTTNQHTDELAEVLDYIESKLPPKPAIKGKRVWVGEYGYPAEHHSPEQQNEKSREVMKAALKWGCPFALYWEMYNNEVKDGKQRGFWLIDDKNVKQPVYYTHRSLCEWGRQFVADAIKSKKSPPSFDQYRHGAVEFIDKLKP